MHPYWWGPHTWGWMWIVPLSLLAVCVLFLLVYLGRGPRWFGGRPGRRILHEAAREILDRRLASGEISKEQYEELKRVLAA